MPKTVDTIDLAASDVFEQLKRSGVWRLMESLPATVEKKIMRRALYAGARVMRDKARELAPVRTGALKKSIVAVSSSPKAYGGLVAKVTVAKGTFVASDTTGKAQKITKKRWRKEGQSLIIPRQYAHLVEYGHSRGTKGRTSAPPHPFMRPAADLKKGEAFEAVAQGIREGVTAEVAKL